MSTLSVTVSPEWFHLNVPLSPGNQSFPKDPLQCTAGPRFVFLSKFAWAPQDEVNMQHNQWKTCRAGSSHSLIRNVFISVLLWDEMSTRGRNSWWGAKPEPETKHHQPAQVPCWPRMGRDRVLTVMDNFSLWKRLDQWWAENVFGYPPPNFASTRSDWSYIITHFYWKKSSLTEQEVSHFRSSKHAKKMNSFFYS